VLDSAYASCWNGEPNLPGAAGSRLPEVEDARKRLAGLNE